MPRKHELKKIRSAPFGDSAVSHYDRLQDILQLLERISQAKGWTYRCASLDEQGWRYATVLLSRSIAPIPQQTRMKCEISVADFVEISFEEVTSVSFGAADLREILATELSNLTWMPFLEENLPAGRAPAALVEQLLQGFHAIVQQLKIRHDGRESIVIEDEYDVQDMLHALLRGFFYDVRPEEVVPSYAGGGSRMDFLLKSERIVIEVKMTRQRLRDREIGDQLIIDIARYQAHPFCRQLFCFVYDPGGYIMNKAGLESDLNGRRGKLNVQVLVSP